MLKATGGRGTGGVDVWDDAAVPDVLGGMRDLVAILLVM